MLCDRAPQERTRLHDAAQRGDVEEVRRLLSDTSININSQTEMVSSTHCDFILKKMACCILHKFILKNHLLYSGTLNNGHFGDEHFLHCSEVVPFFGGRNVWTIGRG